MKTELKKQKTPKVAGYYLHKRINYPENRPDLVELIPIDYPRTEDEAKCDFYCVGGGSGYNMPRNLIGYWSEKLEIEE